MKIEIPLKLPSLNEYINITRTNKFAGSKMKKQIQNDLSWYIKRLPKYDKPIKIIFTWCEANNRRDLDNICFGKKFILDSMQECGIISNDNRKCVTAFEDKFPIPNKEYKVEIEIEEV